MQEDRTARLTPFGRRRQVEWANLLGRATVGRDEEDSLGLIFEDQEAVESQVVDDDAERQVPPRAFVAERNLAAVTVTLDLDGQGDRLAGFDRELERTVARRVQGLRPSLGGTDRDTQFRRGREPDGPQVVDRVGHLATADAARSP